MLKEAKHKKILLSVTMQFEYIYKYIFMNAMYIIGRHEIDQRKNNRKIIYR